MKATIGKQIGKYALALTALLSSSAMANQCHLVRFADVGWTDITSTTAITSEVLEGLGYETSTQLLSVPVTYNSLANNDIDVFLGNWMPTMASDIEKYMSEGSVDMVKVNLTGAKYTLAVNKAAFDAGIKNFSDIAKYKRELKGKIYGIEPGNDGNRLIQKMIDTDAFGLKGFSLVESSEAGMLSQVARSIRRDQWIVFLGWAPHPMNSNFEIDYLDGGDDYFGPNFGGAVVHTNVRHGYIRECPNVGTLLTNIEFSLDMENEVMGAILDKGEDPRKAAREWLQANPSVLDTWLKGVSTKDGTVGLAAVKAHLNI